MVRVLWIRVYGVQADLGAGVFSNTPMQAYCPINACFVFETFPVYTLSSLDQGILIRLFPILSFEVDLVGGLWPPTMRYLYNRSLLASCPHGGAIAVGRAIELLPTQNVIEAGLDNAFVILDDNSLWGWGINAHGALGDGTTTRRDTPVHIMDNVYQVANHFRHTLAVTTYGALWAWGNGRLVSGTGIRNYSSPVEIEDWR